MKAHLMKALRVLLVWLLCICVNLLPGIPIRLDRGIMAALIAVYLYLTITRFHRDPIFSFVLQHLPGPLGKLTPRLTPAAVSSATYREAVDQIVCGPHADGEVTAGQVGQAADRVASAIENDIPFARESCFDWAVVYRSVIDAVNDMSGLRIEYRVRTTVLYHHFLEMRQGERREVVDYMAHRQQNRYNPIAILWRFNYWRRYALRGAIWGAVRSTYLHVAGRGVGKASNA